MDRITGVSNNVATAYYSNHRQTKNVSILINDGLFHTAFDMFNI